MYDKVWNIIIAFDGAVCGFFLIYVIPIMLHMTCYYKEPRRTKSSSKVADSTKKLIDR